jgi:two-component system response regulator DesR
MTVTVVLADDEYLIRSALSTLLPLEADISIVAQASDGAEAYELFAEHRPDVVVLDQRMPEYPGIEAAQRILGLDPSCGVVMLTRNPVPGLLRTALSLGVRGFLGKDSDPAVIAEAIMAVSHGGRYLDNDVSAQALTDDNPLTPREQQLFRLTGEGYSVADIAARVHLSAGTVRNYLSSAIQKTPESTRHEAARHARTRGWL